MLEFHYFANNSLNDGSIVYLNQENGITLNTQIFGDVQQIIVFNSTYIDIYGFQMTSSIAILIISSSHIKINNINLSNIGFGIYFIDVFDMEITNFNVENMKYSGIIGANSTNTYFHTMEFVSSSESIVSLKNVFNVSIVNSNARSSESKFVEIRDSQQILLKNNYIIDIGSDVFFLQNTNHSRIIDNIGRDIIGNGTVNHRSVNMTIIDNIFSNVTGSGVKLSQSINVTVQNNLLYAGNAPLEVSQGKNVSIISNQIESIVSEVPVTINVNEYMGLIGIIEVSGNTIIAPSDVSSSLISVDLDIVGTFSGNYYSNYIGTGSYLVSANHTDSSALTTPLYIWNEISGLDISYIEGNIGNTIEFTVDTKTYFELLKSEIIISTGYVNPDQSLVISVDNLSVGTHQFTLTSPGHFLTKTSKIITVSVGSIPSNNTTQEPSSPTPTSSDSTPMNNPPNSTDVGFLSLSLTIIIMSLLPLIKFGRKSKSN